MRSITEGAVKSGSSNEKEGKIVKKRKKKKKQENENEIESKYVF